MVELRPLPFRQRILDRTAVDRHDLAGPRLEARVRGCFARPPRAQARHRRHVQADLLAIDHRRVATDHAGGFPRIATGR